MGDEKPWRNKKLLDKLYNEENLTQREISDKLNCSSGAVSKWLSIYDLKRDRPWKNKEKLKELYVEKRKTSEEVAEELNCSPKTILDWLKKFEINVRRSGQLQTPVHHYFNNQGYEHIRTHVDGNLKDISVHRLVAVAEYGVSILKEDDLVVHHKNGVKWDNRPQNLEIMEESEHLSKHAMERERTRDSRGRFA